jgi:16S rRNA (cytosine967-C5)-methyltransferase
MTPSARVSAAIDVLSTLSVRRRPAAETLKDWGHAHRFAGSSDRAAIAGLVYDALRRRASAAWIMDDVSPRAIMLGMLALERDLDVDGISTLCNGSSHAPEILSDHERVRLAARSLERAPPWVAGDYPDWLDPAFTQVFGEQRIAELAALAGRAPLDLRVNSLKADPDEVAAALEALRPAPTRWSPTGLRIKLEAGSKSPMIHAEPAFIKGHIEIQDEGSQLAALLSGAHAGEQVVDLCAGGGGKTLALAAMMANRGQIYATDTDRARLAPIHARLTRAGARNVQVRTPGGGRDVLADLSGHAHLVMIDAPCSGTGAWRRNPDAKWRIRPGALEIRRREQTAVLDRAASLVRIGGRIVYVTCSVIEAENDFQIRGFLNRHTAFSIVSPAAVAARLGERGSIFERAVRLSEHGLLMTPRLTDTDGFFVAMVARVA